WPVGDDDRSRTRAGRDIAVASRCDYRRDDVSLARWALEGCGLPFWPDFVARCTPHTAVRPLSCRRHSHSGANEFLIPGREVRQNCQKTERRTKWRKQNR